MSLALAGCAAPGADTIVDAIGDSPVGQSGEMSKEEARALLAGASDAMPDRVRMEMEVLSDGVSVVTMSARFDRAAEVALVEMKGDASLWGAEEGAEMFADGVMMYSSPSGAVYMMDGVAYAFPAGAESGFLPDVNESPFGAFLEPDGATEWLVGDDVEVTSVKPVMHRGQAAVEIGFTSEEGEGKVVVFLASKLVAHFEMRGMFASEEEDEDTPAVFENAVAVGDFFYGEEVGAMPAVMTRAAALSYKSEGSDPFQWWNDDAEEDDDGVQTRTWTFVASGGVALSEVSVHVKAPGAEGPMDVSGETLWSMRLSEGAKSVDGVSVSFEDRDGDGFVSAGDVLSMEWSEDADVEFVLHDDVTGTYVVPGLGVWAFLAGLGLVAFARRRGA